MLDCLIVPSKALDHLIFYGSKVRLQLYILGPLLQFGGDLDPLLAFIKGFERLIPSCKHFYADLISGYTPRKGLI